MNVGSAVLFGLGVFVFLVWRNHHKKVTLQVYTPNTTDTGTAIGPMVINAQTGMPEPAPPKANVAFASAPDNVDYAPKKFPPVIVPVLTPNPSTGGQPTVKPFATKLAPDRTIARIPTSTIDLTGRQKIS